MGGRGRPANDRIPLGGLLVDRHDVDALRVQELAQEVAILLRETSPEEAVQQLTDHHRGQKDARRLPHRPEEPLVPATHGRIG